MRSITTWLLNFLGFLSIAIPPPGNAAMFRQSFEVTVTRFTPPHLSDLTSLDPPVLEAKKLFPALNALPVPPIGTKGLGSYTYDESQLHIAKEFSFYEDIYTLGTLGKIAFSDFSLNFFNHTYTQRTYLPSRIGEFLTYTRTPTGQYIPQSLNLATFDDTSVVTTGEDFFTYRPGPVNLAGGYIGVNSVFGTLRFTDAEPVPEPPASAIVPVLALGLGWLCHRKRLK